MWSMLPEWRSWRFSLHASGSNFRARNFNMSFFGRESRCTPKRLPFESKMGRSSTVNAASAIACSTAPSASVRASSQRCAHAGFARSASSNVRRRLGRPSASVAPPAIERIAAALLPVRASTSQATLNSRSVRAPRRGGVGVFVLMGSYSLRVVRLGKNNGGGGGGTYGYLTVFPLPPPHPLQPLPTAQTLQIDGSGLSHPNGRGYGHPNRGVRERGYWRGYWGPGIPGRALAGTRLRPARAGCTVPRVRVRRSYRTCSRVREGYSGVEGGDAGSGGSCTRRRGPRVPGVPGWVHCTVRRTHQGREEEREERSRRRNG